MDVHYFQQTSQSPWFLSVLHDINSFLDCISCSLVLHLNIVRQQITVVFRKYGLSVKKFLFRCVYRPKLIHNTILTKTHCNK